VTTHWGVHGVYGGAKLTQLMDIQSKVSQQEMQQKSKMVQKVGNWFEL